MISHGQVKGGSYVNHRSKLPVDFFVPREDSDDYGSVNTDSDVSDDYLNSNSRYSSESESRFSSDLSRSTATHTTTSKNMATVRGVGMSHANLKEVNASSHNLRIPLREATNMSSHSLRRVFGSPAPAYVEHGHKYVDNDPDPLNSYRMSSERAIGTHAPSSHARKSSKESHDDKSSATRSSRSARKVPYRLEHPRKFPNEGSFFDGVYDGIERDRDHHRWTSATPAFGNSSRPRGRDRGDVNPISRSRSFVGPRSRDFLCAADGGDTPSRSFVGGERDRRARGGRSGGHSRGAVSKSRASQPQPLQGDSGGSGSGSGSGNGPRTRCVSVVWCDFAPFRNSMC